MSTRPSMSGVRRGAIMALMMLALFVRVILPQGLMVAPAGGTGRIVICTGHGPATIALDRQGQPAKAPKPPGQEVCAFAFCGASTPPADPVLAIAPPAAFAAQGQCPLPCDLAPGRGLAAPPPQAQAPPPILT